MSPRGLQPRVPPIEIRRQPGLTETLEGPAIPGTCRSCGKPATQRWNECDEWDRPFEQPRILDLCEPCGKRLIEPHHRLYIALERNAPQPGAMQICVDCSERDGLRCTSPRARHNGGAGMTVTITKPINAFLCGRFQGSGLRRMWTEPAKACSAKRPVDTSGPTGP